MSVATRIFGVSPPSDMAFGACRCRHGACRGQAGAITGGAIDASSLGVAASSVRLADTGNVIGGLSGISAAPAVTMLAAPAVGSGPYLLNGVAFATAPNAPNAPATQGADQIAQLVVVPTLPTLSQPELPQGRLNSSPVVGGAPSPGSLTSFEPAAGPSTEPQTSGVAPAGSDAPVSPDTKAADDDEDDGAKAKKGGTQKPPAGRN